MEASVLIMCKENYNEDLVKKIYSTLDNNFVGKFEVVLVTSLKYNGVCEKNILLSNSRPNLKCYASRSKNILDIVKYGISRCIYNTTFLVSLEDFSEDKLYLFNSVSLFDFHNRFNAYFSTSNELLAIRTYDLRNILKVCDYLNFRDILNVCEYLNFSLIEIESRQAFKFSNLYTKDVVKRYYKKRKRDKFSIVLCEYVGKRNLGKAV